MTLCKSLVARENQFVANRAEQRILESKRRHGPYPRQYWSRSLYEIVFQFLKITVNLQALTHLD